MIKWKNEKRKVKDLVPWDKNPRRITSEQMEQLKASLSKFGYAATVVLNSDGRIIAGHMRTRAMMELGRGDEEIDVRIADRPLTEDEFRELAIRDNSSGGDYDLVKMMEWNIDELMEWGFDAAAARSLKRKIEEDNYPSEEKYQDKTPVKTKTGDLYRLGDHLLLCGDSTKANDVKKLMGGGVASLVFTSPPYNMAGKMYREYKDDLKSEEYISFNLRVVENLKIFFKGFLCWNISYNKNARWEFIEILHRLTKNSGLSFLELIVWDKGHAMPIVSKDALTRNYEDIFVMADDEGMNDMEMYFIGANNKNVFFNKKTQRRLTNYWKIDTTNSQIENLGACFPVALPAKAIEIMTREKDLVIDPFGGSGTTLIACEQLKRSGRLIEMDPKYCDVIVDRWEKFTGKKAQ